ncbi:DUF6361 family protein [Pandoraea commovens]|uniref:DUF6361 family protein n=1 Tax=Pandoraea commovens TaxID=2508289 RepID=A0ABY5QG47_9BURK|nr:DUF6361 family protein [Pandoraea commovens]UVA79569.1 DUF6361 family protein [Pandoraea commovens]
MTAASRWEWLDFDEAESNQVRDFLSQDVDGEGVDALRIGASVRDRISDSLFPGTSTQYRRLRYVFLIPAVLRHNKTTIDNLSEVQSKFNAALNSANGNETGVIGRRTTGRDFVHLYWTALRTWKFLTPLTGDDRDVTVANGLAALKSTVAVDEEGNPLFDQRVQWDRKVVSLIDEFWADDGAAQPSIHCRQAEVDFILEKWLELPGSPPLAAIASQLRNGKKASMAGYPWDVNVGSSSARTELLRAKAASLICWSAQLAYNFALLKEAKKLQSKGLETTWTVRKQDLGATEQRIAKQYEKWKASCEVEKSTLEPWINPSYWGNLGGEASRRFLADTTDRLMKGETDLTSSDWRDWVALRERVNPAPKLGNPHHLASWSGTPEMATRWDFRWSACVRGFVKDAENPRG